MDVSVSKQTSVSSLWPGAWNIDAAPEKVDSHGSASAPFAAAAAAGAVAGLTA